MGKIGGFFSRSTFSSENPVIFCFGIVGDKVDTLLSFFSSCIVLSSTTFFPWIFAVDHGSGVDDDIYQTDSH